MMSKEALNKRSGQRGRPPGILGEYWASPQNWRAKGGPASGLRLKQESQVRSRGGFLDTSRVISASLYWKKIEARLDAAQIAQKPKKPME